jgi:hypothetical protein
MATWAEFERHEPELATFGAVRLAKPPAYLATVRSAGTPRVHPVTPILGDGGLFVFMEPTSPKGHDLRATRWYGLHNGVPDIVGSGGEFFVGGRATLVEDPGRRAVAAAAASYTPADRYILFELDVSEARVVGYGDVALPAHTRWREPS